MSDIEILKKESSHYAGTLVVHKKSLNSIITDDGKSLEEFDIVDGQQRLTTISLLLSVISEQYALLKKEARAKGIRDTYIMYVENNTNKPRLYLFNDSKDFYIEAVLKKKSLKASTLSQQRIIDALDCLRGYFNQKREEFKEEFLNWLDEF